MSEPAPRYAPWVAPSITPEGDLEVPEQLSAEDVEAVLDQARREGRAQGLALGLKEGRQEVRSRVQRLERLHAALEQPLVQVDEQVQRRLAELSLSLARQVLRVELELRPEALLPVVREAVAALPPSREPPRLHLNPADAALLRESGAGVDWQLVEDPAVAAGGCIVHSAFTEVDATLGTRLDAVIEGFRARLEEALRP